MNTELVRSLFILGPWRQLDFRRIATPTPFAAWRAIDCATCDSRGRRVVLSDPVALPFAPAPAIPMTSTLTALLPLLTLWAASDEPYRTWAPVPAEARSLPETAGHRLSAAELDQLRAGKPILPFSDITTAVKTQDGAIWAGSTHGLMLLAPGGERW